MAKFLLLLHDEPSDAEAMSPEEMGAVVAEYMAWRQRLEDQGRVEGAEKLRDEGGKDLSLVDGRVRVVDGPYSEAKEVVGGYFLIQAEDYDEAVQLSSDCPHLKYGKRIELRQVDEMH